MKKLELVSESFFKVYRDSKSPPGTVDYYEARNYVVDRDNQAYTSLVEGIEGMMKEFVPADIEQVGGLESNEWKFVPEEGCMCGMASLTDILENVVKPLYGKK